MFLETTTPTTMSSVKRRRDDGDIDEKLLKKTSVYVRDLDGSIDETVFPYATPEYSTDVGPGTWMSIESARINSDTSVGALTSREVFVVMLKRESIVVIASAERIWPVYYDIRTQRPRTDFKWLIDRPFDKDDVCSGTLDDVSGNFSVTMTRVKDAVNKAINTDTE
jgi:hypothetical protein